jgi:hypothetical protein
MVDVKEKRIMDIDPMQVETLQPELFIFGETSEGTLELFPAVWWACEELVATELSTRQSGLTKLLELNAPRLSSLVAYLLATRVTEPDLGLRTQVVSALAGLLIPDTQGKAAPENVRRALRAYLIQIRMPALLALLEVGVSEPEMESNLAVLFNACPEAGLFLVEILSDRHHLLAVRCEAVRLINQVGYLEALPELERIAARLESRIAGQQGMPFAPPVPPNEGVLLEEVRTALQTLRQP